MEEPIEPPCWVRVLKGGRALDEVLAEVKVRFYEYNRAVRGTRYYLKPVHKVYKHVGGARRTYEYYGRYWYRVEGRRFRYVGTETPRGLPDPPKNPLAGLSVIREEDDLIIRCELYDKFRQFFVGLEVRAA
ncbi:MAG: hypothetical protein N3D79_02515 [Acidilobaceae archaeon]|nr:hypothetical protein [Acidilobaceae archaeon]